MSIKGIRRRMRHTFNSAPIIPFDGILYRLHGTRCYANSGVIETNGFSVFFIHPVIKRKGRQEKQRLSKHLLYTLNSMSPFYDGFHVNPEPRGRRGIQNGLFPPHGHSDLDGGPTQGLAHLGIQMWYRPAWPPCKSVRPFLRIWCIRLFVETH